MILPRLTLLAALPLLLGNAPDPARLEVSLSGLRSDHGLIRLCVWHGPSRFLDSKCAGDSIVVPATEAEVRVPLMPGDYAVSLIHDENGNGKLDKNLFGIPTEGVGFSQNPKLSFGPPTYAASRFDVAGDTNETIKLKYFL